MSNHLFYHDCSCPFLHQSFLQYFFLWQFFDPTLHLIVPLKIIVSTTVISQTVLLTVAIFLSYGFTKGHLFNFFFQKLIIQTSFPHFWLQTLLMLPASKSWLNVEPKSLHSPLREFFWSTFCTTHGKVHFNNVVILINKNCSNNQNAQFFFQINDPWRIISAYFWFHIKVKITN